MRNRKKENHKNVIMIKEDVRVPGTDILLEKGDRIEVLNEENVYQYLQKAFLMTTKYEDDWEAGFQIGQQIERTIEDPATMVEDTEAFLAGIKDSIMSYR